MRAAPKRGRAGASDDSRSWSAFEREVVRPLFEGIDPVAPVRAWVTGRIRPADPLAIALGLASGAMRRHHHGPIRVIAGFPTAVEVDRARRSVLSAEWVERLPKSWRDTAREAAPDLASLGTWLRRSLVYATHRLGLDPPFGQLDLVVAVQPDLTDATIARGVAEHLAFALHEGGVLWLNQPIELDAADFERAGRSGRLFRRVRRRMSRADIDALVSEVVAADRFRLGEALHDGLGQHLTALSLAVHRLRQLTGEAVEAKPVLDRIEELMAAMRQGVRAIARGELRLPAGTTNLADALREAIDDARRALQADVTLDLGEPVETLDENVVTQLVRIAQEAIRNAALAKAKHIRVSLRKADLRVELAIRDDGHGIAAEHPYRQAGLGLRLMRHRAHTIGATLRFSSGGGGTTILCAF